MEANLHKKLDYAYLHLKGRITTGHWKVGDRIPTETELTEEFKCSRSTISKAIARLSHEGLVERKTKAGTKVIRRTAARDVSSLDLDACAFIHPGDAHEGVWRIVRGFQQAAQRAGRRTLTLSTGADFSKEAEILGRLSEFNVKGAVIYPVILQPRDNVHYEQMMLACPFPIVLAELNIIGSGRPVVSVDGFHAGYVTTRHLLQQGLKRVGFAANRAWTQNVRDKYTGYRQAINEAGLKEDANDVLMDWGMNPDAADSLGGPLQVARTFLETHRGLEGVVCADDFLAHGCLAAARELGLAVPQQLKIVGMDDLRSLQADEVELTAYRVPYEKIGQRTFETLNALLQDQPLPFREIQIPGELAVRRSA